MADARAALELGSMATKDANNYITSSQISSNYIRKNVTDDLFYKSSVSDLDWNSSTAADKKKPISMAGLAYWDGSYDAGASNLAYCNKDTFDTMATKNANNYVEMKWKNFSNTTNSLNTLTLTPDTGYYPLAICGTIRRYDGGNSANTSETVNFYTPVSGTVDSKTTFNFTVYQASINGTMHINSSN